MSMNEFGITKIMDGIFISDLSLMQVFVNLLRISSFLSVTKSLIFLCGPMHKHKSISINPISKFSGFKDMGRRDPCLHQISLWKFMILWKSPDKNFCAASFVVIFNQKLEWFYLLTSWKSSQFIIWFRFSWDLETAFKYIGLRFNDFSPRV